MEDAEIRSLFTEVVKCKANSLPEHIKKEFDTLNSILSWRGYLYELDLLPLRICLVDVYSKNMLIAKTEYELSLYEEYMVTDDDYREYDDLKEEIDEIKQKCEDEADEEDDGNSCKKLRAKLKILREKVAWYDRTWAGGEIIRNCISYWATLTVIVSMVMGLLPIIHPQGKGVITLLSWAIFGLAGALISVLTGISKAEVPEIGEQEGKQLLLRTVISGSIGITTSILLYAALWGGILAGKIFPDFTIEGKADSILLYNGLSIFWGFFSGFSLRILAGLSNIAESAFGKESS